ncbi:hypothetical protein GWI33_001438 [Rhynchophorus ferrugineus]|uniref:Uncharacterized protein n=1 Tax=Rhynchophorus ferrugineus TaxID=354439 RepID=A0A834J3D6_RHYFE|nr:hypothetical protein GWI33_001438 [Rhynchophorus ferrugineus]
MWLVYVMMQQRDQRAIINRFPEERQTKETGQESLLRSGLREGGWQRAEKCVGEGGVNFVETPAGTE